VHNTLFAFPQLLCQAFSEAGLYSVFSVTKILFEKSPGCFTVLPIALPKNGDAAAAPRSHGAFFHVALRAESPFLSLHIPVPS
jgi:hypothetical protein